LGGCPLAKVDLHLNLNSFDVVHEIVLCSMLFLKRRSAKTQLNLQEVADPDSTAQREANNSELKTRPRTPTFESPNKMVIQLPMKRGVGRPKGSKKRRLMDVDPELDIPLMTNVSDATHPIDLESGIQKGLHDVREGKWQHRNVFKTIALTHHSSSFRQITGYIG
jgi:hypothetical protein